MARYVRLRAKIDDSILKGDSITAAAEKVVKTPAVPTIKSKFAHARRLYETAAEAYLIGGKWLQAARCYAMCAECELRLGCILEAASYYADAGSFACRLDNTIAVRYFSLAVSNFVKDGKFKQGAACERVLGEVCKADGAHKDAGMAFVYSAELYMTADDYQQAALMFHQAGAEYLEAKDYMDARKAFENAAVQADADNLMRYRSPTFLLSSALSLLATGDVPACEAFLLTLCKKYPLFATRRESTFFNDILSCAKLMDHHGFIDHVWNYDYVKKLESYELEVLKRVNLMFVAEIVESSQARDDAEKAARRAVLRKAMQAPKADDLGAMPDVS